MKPENSPLLACPHCGAAASQTSSAGGICLRCAGARVLALESADFTGVGPSFGAETPSAPTLRATGLNPPERIGAYEIIEEIGRGGMGRVFAARQTGLGRIVALKVIAESAATAGLGLRFRREIQTIAQLRHPGIVAVHDTGREDGFVYFSMDYIESGDLARRLRERPPAPRESAILLQKIAAALAYAHAAGILHRDLKPSNILLDGEEPQLADFGLAAQLEAGGDLTAQSGVLGTPHYLAPEALLHGSAALTIASDIYALGVIAFELITGRTPYAGASPAELPTLLLNSDPPAPRLVNPAVPRDLETICLKCLERDPTRRYTSASALEEDLRRFLAGEAIAAQPPSALYRFNKFARRHRLAFAAAAAVAVVLIAATLVSASLAVRATRAEKNAAAEAAAARAVSDFLRNDLLAQASPRNEPDRDLKVRTLIDRAVKTIDGRFTDQPLVEAALRETLYSTYYSLGEVALAKPQLERAIDLNRRFLPADDAHALNVASSLSNANLSLGDHVTAERQAREIYDRQLRLFGPEHPDTLTTATYLASAIQRAGRHAEATELFRRTLAARIRAQSPDAYETLNLKVLLAESLSAQGKFAESQELKKAVFETQRRVLGPGHSSTLRTQTSMGATYYSMGQLAESIAIYRDVLPRLQRLYGPEASTPLSVMGNLAASLRANGDLAEAAVLLEQILPASRRTRGLEHPSTISAMESLGTVYRLQGKFAEAEPLLRESVEMVRRVRSLSPSLTVAVLESLANLYQEQARFEEGGSLIHEAVDLCRRTFGPEHPNTTNAVLQEAFALQDQLKYSEALVLFQQAAESYRKSLGADHPSTLTALLSAGTMLLRMGEIEAAAPLLREAFEGRKRKLTSNHLGTLLACDRLAQVLIAQRQFAEAENLLRPNLEARRHTTAEQWRVQETQSLLGEALGGLGRNEEAEALLLDAHAKLAALVPTMPARMQIALHEPAARLARFYTNLGRTDEARRWTETAAKTEMTVRP